MASITSAMTRNLQRFVEYDLAGLVSWQNCKVMVPKKGGGDIVEIMFTVDHVGHVVIIEAPGEEIGNHRGRIILDGEILGVIDAAVWKRAAEILKQETLNGREPQSAA